MADDFDPIQAGAVAVQEPPQFNPVAAGAVPVSAPIIPRSGAQMDSLGARELVTPPVGQNPSLTETIFGPTAGKVIENAGQAGMDIVRGIPGMIESLPETAYQGLKFAAGGPQEKAQVLEQVVAEALPQGRQIAEDVQSPLGSRESFRGLASLGMLAIPSLTETIFGRATPEIPVEAEKPPIQAVEPKEIQNAKSIPENETSNDQGVRQEESGNRSGQNVEQTPQGNRADSGQGAEVAPPKVTSQIRGQEMSTGDDVRWMSGGTWDGKIQDIVKKEGGTHDVTVRATNGDVFTLKDAEHYGINLGRSNFITDANKPSYQGWEKDYPDLAGEPQEQGAQPVSTEGKTPAAQGNTKEVTPTAETPTTSGEAAPQGQAAPPTEKPPVQAGDELPPEIPNPVRGSGKFRQSYQVDKELGDRMESIGASKESGALRSEIASRRLLDELTPEQESDLGKYLVSKRLETVNPDHPQVLSPEETSRIESDPTISKALDTYKNEIKPEVEGLRKQAGLSEEAAAGKGEEFISLLRKPVPETTGGAVNQASKLSRTTRFAQKAEGQAQEYDTDLRNVLEHSYTEVTRKARVAEFYKSVQRKGLAEPSTVYTANGPRSAVTFNDLPPELQHDLRAATEQELQPTGIAKALRASQRFTTGIALTANPAELLNHMRRQLNLVAAKPPIGRGILPRLEAVIPYIGPKVGTFVRTITDNMSKPENMAVLQDIFDAGGGSSRSFSSMYKSNIPGIRQLQTATHDLLFGIPKGNGIGGWDLRMRVQLEKIRRSAEGNTDPQRIREFANQIGQYGSHPDWLIRGLRTINPYAATTLPMRLTELKTAVGKSDLQSGGGGKLGRTAETLLRGTGGTLLGLASANYLLSGKFPWDNDKGHEFDLNTGLKGEDGKSVYMKFRVVAPELARPVATAALPNLSREGEAKQPQYLSAFLTGLANQGLSLVSGPAQNALLTALTGKAPYITKAPGQRPEVMDIAKTEKGGNRGLEQIKHAAAAVNPLGTALVEEPYHTGVTGPLKYVEQPVPGVRPFGSVFTKAYEKKAGKGKKIKAPTGEDTTPLN